MTAPGRPAAPATKTARQARIVAILSREQVHSQEQLAGLLAQYAGLHVAQATLSRDLDELGVVRLRGADGTLVYALPGDPGGPGSRPGTGLDLSNYPERSEAPRAPSAPTPTPADPDPSAPGAANSPHPATAGSSPGPGVDAGASPGPGVDAGASPGPGVDAGASPGPDVDAGASPGPDVNAGASPRPDVDTGAPPGPGVGAGGSPASGADAGRSSGSGTDATTPPHPGDRSVSGATAVAADAAVGGHATPVDRAGQPPRLGVGPVGPVGAVSARFTRYLKELLTSAEGSANIVVLRTPAGAAQFLASTIDHAAWPAVLGTVAGDDTVLVISRDPTGGEALAAEFRHLAEGRR